MCIRDRYLEKEFPKNPPKGTAKDRITVDEVRKLDPDKSLPVIDIDPLHSVKKNARSSCQEPLLDRLRKSGGFQYRSKARDFSKFKIIF